jgi:predicted GNAT family N-acyltransferase
MLVTANGHEKRGAGTLLLQWGIEKSQESGLPIYLESSPEALTLYRNNGFEQDGEIKVWDRDRFGFTGPNTLIPMIRRPG